MYASHYRKAGMQLSLGKDVMISRSIEKSGRLIAAPVVSSPHHRHARI